MVETKMPQTLRDVNYYRPLQDTLKKADIVSELRVEIKSCGTVIYTDGITWMFLCLDKNDEIVERDKFETICLVDLNKKKKYYSTYEFELLIEDTKWNYLISAVKRLVSEKSSK